MFQQVLKLLPHDPGTITLAVSAVGAIVGLVLWVIGLRVGRVILTLVAVAMGTGIGMKLPQWFNWSIDPMATGTGLALVLGLGAYTLHKFWLGTWLGALLTAWAAVGAWVLLGHGAWHYPAYHGSQQIPRFLCDLWDSLPKDMQRWMPYLAAISLIGGLAMGVFFPRFAAMFFWSAAGTSLFFCMGSIVAFHFRPALLDKLPRQFWPQVASLCGAIALGMFIQWRLGPRTKAKSSGAKKLEPEPSHSH
ncbi:MAG: hypothetical protein ABSF29_03535 [Tepidisphaeraceae bacterium]|jgi:hypothetical protein